jgi:hypothetical protein
MRLPGMTRFYSRVWFVSGNLSTIPPFHLSTFKDPVIRVLFFWFMKAKRKAATKPPVLL